MNTAVYPLVFVAGLGLLYVGAEGLVNGSVRLARVAGVSPLVVGLTLVAFGTSMPELAVSTTAAFRGAVDLAFGNLVGSNIANIGLILGAAALVRPLAVKKQLVPVVIAVSLGTWGLAADGEVDRWDGLIMLACFAALLLYTHRVARRDQAEWHEKVDRLAGNERSIAAHGNPTCQRGLVRILPRWRVGLLWNVSSRATDVLLVIAGLAGLIAGAQLMVYSAVELARVLGVSELVIGLTIVAVGTSLPELATSTVAAFRGEADIAIGNIVGSNNFNLLCILALTAQVRPVPVHASSLRYDLPVMIGFAMALVPIMLSGLAIRRWEGAVLLAGYASFLAYQIWR
jgi:cation:H+ antiporter